MGFAPTGCNKWFQHTAARRRLIHQPKKSDADYKVSTHSRPKAAESAVHTMPIMAVVSTHSRPKAAEVEASRNIACTGVSTHSRPKAAEPAKQNLVSFRLVSTHSRPKAAELSLSGCKETGIVSTHSRPKAADAYLKTCAWEKLFQHTAARRRLKGLFYQGIMCLWKRFNTQPPEGG